MTEKDLDEYKEESIRRMNGGYIDIIHIKELIELARKGIWARDKAIPALKYYGSYMDDNNPEFLKGGFQKYPSPKVAKEALEALPEEK